MNLHGLLALARDRVGHRRAYRDRRPGASAPVIAPLSVALPRDPDLGLPYYVAKSRGHAREMLAEAYTAAMAEASRRGITLAHEPRALIAEHALDILEREAGIDHPLSGGRV